MDYLDKITRFAVDWFAKFVTICFVLVAANTIAGTGIEGRYIAAVAWLIAWVLSIQIVRI